MKACTKCGETLPAESFSKLRAQCKACRKAYEKGYYAANRERKKAYRTTCKEVIARKNKAYWESNREVLLEKKKSSREASLEAIREKEKAYRLANREVRLEGFKAYRAANRELLVEMQAARRKNMVDGYVKSLLCKGTFLRAADIPKPLIEAKKAQLRILRELRKEKP